MESSQGQQEQAVTMTPQEYLDAFQQKKNHGNIKGVCGRFFFGKTDEDFEYSERRDLKFCFIAGEDMLSPILGMTPIEGLIHVGIGIETIKAIIVADGLSTRFMAFPPRNAVLATWENVFALIKQLYGDELHNKLSPFIDQLSTTPFNQIDGHEKIQELANTLTPEEKQTHPDFMELKQFNALEKVELHHARALLYHHFDLNEYYLGNGCNKDGQFEYLIENQRVDAIEGQVTIKLDITEEQIEERIKYEKEMGARRSKYLIETAELQTLIDNADPNLRIINASWYMPAQKIVARDEHLEKRLTKDTVFFDHDKIVDPDSTLPHALPSLEVFKKCMIQLGVRKTDNIVCYDQHSFGMMAVARAAWMLRYFGCPNVRILNGGLKKWEAEGRTTYSQTEGDYSFEVVKADDCILDIKQVHELAGKLYKAESASSLDFQILDARAKARWAGEVAEPRAGLRSGCIKNSINVPFMVMLNEDGTFKGNEDLLSLFKEKGIDANKPTVNTCGSGVTACVLDLALRLLGNDKTQVYDGSWSEYGGVDEPKQNW